MTETEKQNTVNNIVGAMSGRYTGAWLTHDVGVSAGVFVRIAPTLHTAEATLSSERLFQYAPVPALLGVPIACQLAWAPREETLRRAAATDIREERRIVGSFVCKRLIRFDG